MSILIRGMEMPTSCRDCDFLNWGAVDPNRCEITDCFIGGDYDKRHDNCPLVPVPPHGRWIDLDSCMAFCSNCNSLGCWSNYCPNCGAKMENANEEDTNSF